MEKVINNLTNIANSAFERMILLTPEPNSPYYWTMIASLIALLALLIIWLLVRLYMARETRVSGEAEITLSEVAAQAAADAQAGTAVPGGKMADEQDRDESPRPTDGFQFFKKRSKANASGAGTTDFEDDVFLLGLEQEMLATRQLYLDGLISKEVYVTETRALYDKAQTRMT